MNIARPNLHILVNSHVTRLLFSPEPSSHPLVTGVEFTRQGTLHTVAASRTVILSAGVVNSPQILLLSGIGPRAHLRAMGIPLRADLPVGSTLYDHVTALSDVTVRDPADVTLSGAQYASLNAHALAGFITNGTGPLVRLALTETYTATGLNGNRDWPDGLLWFIFAQILSSKLDEYLNVFAGEQRDAWRQYYRPFTDSNQHLFFGASLVRPHSSGSVRLASPNPLDAPLIDYNFLEDGQDLAALTEVLRTLMRILESPVMAPYLAYSTLPIPGCSFCADGRPLSSCTSYLVCAARSFTIAMFHPTSSCPMGNSSSPRAVVDERLRVKGVWRLRVMDASVMPMVVNTNTNAAVMMIAERGVHLLREDEGLL